MHTAWLVCLTCVLSAGMSSGFRGADLRRARWSDLEFNIGKLFWTRPRSKTLKKPTLDVFEHCGCTYR